MTEDTFKTAPHTPAHLFRAGAVYLITGSIYQKAPLIRSDARKEQWLSVFRQAAKMHDWPVIAWVVLGNHYHVMVQAPETSAENLFKFVGSYHKFTAREWNDQDGQNGRKVWWNYWDTCIRSEKDYRVRINYVHWNPVKHGLVERPEDYLFSSYRDFLANGLIITPKSGVLESRQIEDVDPCSDLEDIPDDF